MHVKPFNIRSFICGKVFRRDEIQQHIINIHQEIIPGLGSGWIVSRCPLSYLGCSFSVDNLAPNSDKYRIKFSRVDDNFCCRYINVNSVEVKKKNKSRLAKDFSSLPVEILFYICQYLDPISLRSLSLTCKGIRDVCSVLVRTRGCVTPVWERQKARGQRRHKSEWVVVNYKWFFSSSMTTVRRWININIPEMQHHLQSCKFNDRNIVSRNPSTELHKKLQEELKRRVELKQNSGWFIQ